MRALHQTPKSRRESLLKGGPIPKHSLWKLQRLPRLPPRARNNRVKTGVAAAGGAVDEIAARAVEKRKALHPERGIPVLKLRRRRLRALTRRTRRVPRAPRTNWQVKSV